jgi:nucleoside-diphosphate-sugar epimerase
LPTYLLAGGAGFIGSHLTERLLAEGGRVICVDSLISGVHENLAHLLANPELVFISHDIREPLPLEEPVDYVLNLACPASPVDYRKYPLQTLETCAQGTQRLLEIALAQQTRFFHVSTSEIYGDPQVHPQPESYWGHVHSYGERSCYDEGKRYAEALIYYYRQDLGVNTGMVRTFNTYGPRMRPYDGRVVSSFVREALRGEELTVFGDGSQTRSFCYISDQVEGQMRMIHSAEEGPINLGNPDERTVLELAELVLRLTGSKSKIVHRPLTQDDPTHRKPDLTLARERLGWEPRVPLEEGLAETIAWFKGQGYR